jgi:4-carboxymuconolactone decarboxylase
VLQFSDGMTHTPVDVPDSLFDLLKAHFNEAQLVELTAAIAWENYRARFNHAFGIESANFTEGAVCALSISAASQAR